MIRGIWSWSTKSWRWAAFSENTVVSSTKATIIIKPRISVLRRTSFHLFKFSIFLLKPASFPSNIVVQTSSCLFTNYLEGQSTNRPRWTCQSMFQLMIQMQILNGSNYGIFSILMIFANHPVAPQEWYSSKAWSDPREATISDSHDTRGSGGS